MGFAAGIAQQLRIGKETVWGTAPAAGSGRLVRRVTCDIATSKESFQSAELLPHYQLADLRHGQASSKGTLTAEPSPGAHSDLIASALRKTWAAGGTMTPQTTITAAASAPHFTRSGGSFITDGFKVGDVVRWTGWTSPATANNSRNYIITTLTATQMTVVDPGSITGTVAAKAAGDSVSCSTPGKKSFIPTTGHTDESYSVERWYSDIGQGELFRGVKVGGLSVKFSAGAMGSLSIPLSGSGYTNADAQYFTSPTAVSSTSVLAGANAGMLVAGGVIAYVRDLDITLDNSLSPASVIGSNEIQGIMQGQMKVTGNLTAYFQDATMRDYFLNETEVSLVFAAFTGPIGAADFMQFCMPRVKMMGSSKPDGPGLIAMPMQFQALYNGTGGTGTTSEQTSLSVQDSLAV